LKRSAEKGKRISELTRFFFFLVTITPHSPGHVKINGQTSPWAEERPKAEMLEDFKGFQEECLAMLGAIEKPSVWGIL
jgi:hypothetical protein